MTEDFFGHLDDPAPPGGSDETLQHVVSRGRAIRRRRHTVMAGAAAVVLAGTGIGIAAAAGSHRSAYDDVQVPASTVPTESPAATPTPSAHRSSTTVVAGPHHSGQGTNRTGAATTVCDGAAPSSSPGAESWDSPSPTMIPSDLPLVTTPTPDPTSSGDASTCVGSSPSPTATPSPTDSGSAAPTDSATPDATDAPAASPSPGG